MSDFNSSKEKKLQRIIESEKILNEIQDMDVLLERVLTEARGIVHADAGSIFILENNILKMTYLQQENAKEIERLYCLLYLLFLLLTEMQVRRQFINTCSCLFDMNIL